MGCWRGSEIKERKKEREWENWEKQRIGNRKVWGGGDENKDNKEGGKFREILREWEKDIGKRMQYNIDI